MCLNPYVPYVFIFHVFYVFNRLCALCDFFYVLYVFNPNVFNSHFPCVFKTLHIRYTLTL